jgi:hypothetical protein
MYAILANVDMLGGGLDGVDTLFSSVGTDGPCFDYGARGSCIAMEHVCNVA